MKYCYRRQIIQYDPIIGYRFTPNLYSRICREDITFIVETNEQGFRDDVSFEEKNKSKKIKILALGDSFIAGDQVSNNERFMDIIGKRFDVEVFNAGLPGSGTDQQLLIQEQITSKLDYDILVIAPFMHNLLRNLTSKVFFLDFATKRQLDIRKPYFELDDNQRLILRNSPVPIADDFFLKNGHSDMADSYKVRGMVRDKLPGFYENVQKAKRNLLTFAYRNHLLKADNYFSKGDNSGWQLMRAILERMIRNAGERPVVVIPIPFRYYVTHCAPPVYLDRFNELASSNVYIVDILPHFLRLSKQERDAAYVPDGHFSATGNRIIAEACNPLFSKLTGKDCSIAKKEVSTSIRTKKSKRHILGLSCYYHDSAAAIVRDGEIVAAAQEERFTRVRHDKSFPINAINYCLEEARIDVNDIDAITFYDSEYLTLERMIATQVYIGPKKKRQLKQILPIWASTKFNIWSRIKSELNYSGQFYRGIHHRSHAASAFYPSPFDEAAILTIDGVGEWSTTTLGIGEKNKITILRHQRFPHSLGLLYSAFTSFCGFKVNSGEYKLMGLAPYGEPKYKDQILNNLIDVKDDGSYKLNLDYFSFLEGNRMTNSKFAELFEGPGREKESNITQRECDIASSIQAVTEEILLRIATYCHKISGKDYLVLAGGVALNCVANGRILREGPFKELWIQPASGDAGGAIGVALDVWYSTWKNERKIGGTNQKDSCFCPSFSTPEIKSFLDYNKCKYHFLEEKDYPKIVANYLAQGKVVGIFSGRMEYGPRALGSRSIFGDPRRVEMQKVLNMKIKFRESFRPFAPIVLEEKASDYFEIDCPSPYMLLVAPVKDSIRVAVPQDDNPDLLLRLNSKRSSIPAITHVDYSARIQTVSKERSPDVYRIVEAFENETGCAVLVNTSFNVRGEPIVCIPDEAYRCFMRTEMDILMLGEFMLIKEEQPKWEEEKNWQSEYELD